MAHISPELVGLDTPNQVAELRERGAAERVFGSQFFPRPRHRLAFNSRPLARPLRAFGSAELLSPFPKRLKSPAPASEGLRGEGEPEFHRFEFYGVFTPFVSRVQKLYFPEGL